MQTPMRALGWALAALYAISPVHAQVRESQAVASAALPAAGEDMPALGVMEWLQRMHTAAHRRAYVGIFVVSANGGILSSARIWHAWEGGQQVERVEALSGPPRLTFRQNDLVLTFLPESRVVKSEKREVLSFFPSVPEAPHSSIASFYQARPLGKARVAGFETDVVQLQPRDAMRFGYRIWTERRSGLLMKLQTLDPNGQIIEQSAFSELQLDAPVKLRKLHQMMPSTAGYRTEKAQLEITTPEAQGWTLKRPVPGFKTVNCYRRMVNPATRERAIQWIFSDGLASVSLFLQPYDAQRRPQEGQLTMGATYTLTRRIPGKDGDWWLSAMGEVPPQTLEAFAQSLARLR